MRTKLNVHPEATLAEIRFYRCFNGANFEVSITYPRISERINRATVTLAATISPSM